MGLKGGAKSKVADYLMSWHIGVCTGPVDEVREIYFNEKAGGVGAAVTESSSRTLTNTSLFGGDQSGGGVSGLVCYMLGGAQQQCAGPLAQRLGGSKIPAFRNVLSLFFTGQGTGGFLFGTNNAYLPPIAVKTATWCHVLDDNSRIGSDLINGAYWLYEIMTSQDFGMAESPDRIDAGSYLAAGAVLRSEGFGLAPLWDRSTTIEDHVKDILSTIGATQDINPRTGLWTLKLLRADYDPATLRVLDESNSELVSFQRKLPAEVVNEVVVTWTNPANEKTETVRAQNIALIESQGGVVSSAVTYEHVRSSDQALKLANRDLQTVCMPLSTAQISADRTLWDVAVGEVVRAVYPRRNMPSTVMRVVKVDYGSPTDDAIIVDLAQDVFGVVFSGAVAYGSDFDPVNVPPAPITVQRLATAPYFVLAMALGDSQARAVAYPASYAFLLVAASTPNTFGVDFYIQQANAAGVVRPVRAGSLDPQDRATIGAALVVEATTVVPALALPLSADVGDFLLFTANGSDAADELCVVTAVDTGFTLRRGVLDTVPRAWPAGTIVWHIAAGATVFDSNAHMIGETAEYRFLPVTTSGQLAFDAAPPAYDLLTDRVFRPLRNANVRANGKLFDGGSIPKSGGLTITWSRRNRLTETSQILAWSDADVYPETGQTTTIEMCSANGATIYTSFQNLSGTSYTVSDFSWLSTGVTAVLIRVVAVRDGLRSLCAAEIPCTLS